MKYRCPLCGADSDKRTWHWNTPPTPLRLVLAWEDMGEPSAIVVSRDLMKHTCTMSEEDFAEHPSPLFGLGLDASRTKNHVSCTTVDSGGFWMAPGNPNPHLPWYRRIWERLRVRWHATISEL